MNKKELMAEERELATAVNVLRAALRSIAGRKARRYEHEFLIRVRDMLDREIGDSAEVSEYSADYVACQVKKEIQKS